MKHRLSLLKTTLLLIGGGLVALMSFTSCENFMKSGQVRDEIVDAIAYNNAPSCAVNFTDEGMGEFLGNKKETFKVGYAVQIQFEVNQDDYYFTGFEAVTNDSEKTPLSDSVKFENADDDNRNASKGIYKYNVTILKHNKNILIRPVCKLLPKVTQITPKFESSGCDQDTPIQITFNKAVNSETFDPASISIFADEDLAQYFNTPQLTSDKKTIYISQKELILKPNDTKNFLNIEVDYNFTSLKDADGLTLTAQGTHSYKINKSFGEQKFVKVLPQTDDAYGKFLSTEEKDCTVGYTIDIQFTLKKQDYKFVKFIPVISNGTTETSADCVIFENEEYDDQAGIYKASVKVTKALNDKEKIIIRPECLLVPRITSVYPLKDNTSYPQDTSIKIYFNKAIKLSDFADQNGFLKNIIITTGSQDLLDTQDGKTPYYKSPYLEDEGKTLVIPFVSGNYLISDNQSKDIQVTLQLEGLKDAVEGENVLFAQDEYSFAYKINGEKDSTPPVLKTLNIARTQQDAMNGTNLISVEEFSHYAAKANYNDDSTKVAANIQNHHVNKVWVYFEAEDSQSGAEYLEIKEQLIRDTAGQPKQGSVIDKTTNASNCIYNLTETNSFSGCFEYDFRTLEDGVVNLTFKLFDYAGKSVNKSVDFVKDTLCDLKVTFGHSDIKYLDDAEDKNNILYNVVIKLDDTKKIYVKDLDGNEYSDTFLTSNEMDFSGTVSVTSICYGPDEKNMTLIDLQNQDYCVTVDGGNNQFKKEYHVPVYVDPHKKSTIKADIIDTADNTNTRSFEIQPVSDVLSYEIIPVEISGKSCTRIQVISSKIPPYSRFQAFGLSEQGEKLLLDDHDGYMVTPNYTYATEEYQSQPDKIYIVVRGSIGEGYVGFNTYYGRSLILQKSNGTWVPVSNSTEQLTENDIPSFDIQLSEAVPDSSGTRKVRVVYDNSFNFNPDYYYLIKLDNKYYSTNEFILESRTDLYSFSVVVYNQSGQFIASSVKQIDLSYDNIAPELFDFGFGSYIHGGFKGIIGTTTHFSDKGGSGLKQQNGKPILQYLLFNDEGQLPTNKNEWKNNSFVKDANFISETEFYIECYGNWPKIILLYTEDNNGNYAIDKYTPVFYEDGFIPEVTFQDNIFKENVYSRYSPAKHEFIKNNKWEKITDTPAYHSDTIEYTYNLNETNGETLSFIRIIPSWTGYSGGTYSYNINNIPTYFYAPYLMAKDTQNPLVCDLKDICMGQSGLNVLADQPCFVHTMYCPHKLGNTPEDWLDGGIEIGLVMKQKSFTYTWDNTSQVPDDYYYAIIVHFADGTVLMSPVMQK